MAGSNNNDAGLAGIDPAPEHQEPSSTGPTTRGPDDTRDPDEILPVVEEPPKTDVGEVQVGEVQQDGAGGNPASEAEDKGPGPEDQAIQMRVMPVVPEEGLMANAQQERGDGERSSAFVARGRRLLEEPALARPFPNGYHFPPRYPFSESVKIGARAFFDFALMPYGFFVVLYCVSIVALGAMLTLLLFNAVPSMCRPDCDHMESPRRQWIERDAQILNILFCITAFGFAPARIRDTVALVKFRIGRYDARVKHLRRLAGYHCRWFRLEGSEWVPADVGPDTNLLDSQLPFPASAVPFPQSEMARPPLSGKRAPATKTWKLDVVIWLLLANSLLQAGLASLMWSMGPSTRPSWATGLFVGLACVTGGAGGLVIYFERRAIKSIEGVPVTRRDLDRLQVDREMGIWHYNNIKDKYPDAGRGDQDER